MKIQETAADDTLDCVVCGTQALALAWFDPYTREGVWATAHKYDGCGAYVCRGCLSERRQNEIAEIERRLQHGVGI